MVELKMRFPDAETAQVFQLWMQRTGAAQFDAVCKQMPRRKRIKATVVRDRPRGSPDGSGGHSLLLGPDMGVVE